MLDREVVTPAQNQDVDGDGGDVFNFEKIFVTANA
ncbi:hypothetical protein PR003_g9341 [Phytophthora rubi]|uniref:Uncharacterized protein n=1 Tax=Phytophthora rubi TaxID=129364 RepID=A0A6A4F8G9_9STRA|nr:hypothetical protein PR002_g13282 [Phytophthora rubi]KAE9342673.1 hypothetical protein PR003_g9341 [Phytophthora rubi]